MRRSSVPQFEAATGRSLSEPLLIRILATANANRDTASMKWKLVAVSHLRQAALSKLNVSMRCKISFAFAEEN